MPDPIRVLVVDDDYRVADIHSGFVREVDGFDIVGVAHTAREALAMSNTVAPDLVLLDIYLPDGHGTEILEYLREERSVDCIVLTAARDLHTVKRCLDLGALHYLIKPFTRDELVERLAAYRRWRQTWQDRDHVDQALADHIFHGRGRTSESLPKGLSTDTMELVVEVLAKSTEPLGAEDVAQLTGISRVSVRRYLRHLADTGTADLVQNYGAPGRPRHRFRLLDQPHHRPS